MYPHLTPGDLVLYNSPTAPYSFENGWDEPKEVVVIGQDKDTYFTREYSPGKFTGFHKSRLIKIIKHAVGKQLELF